MNNFCVHHESIRPQPRQIKLLISLIEPSFLQIPLVNCVKIGTILASLAADDKEGLIILDIGRSHDGMW